MSKTPMSKAERSAYNRAKHRAARVKHLKARGGSRETDMSVDAMAWWEQARALAKHHERTGNDAAAIALTRALRTYCEQYRRNA